MGIGSGEAVAITAVVRQRVGCLVIVATVLLWLGCVGDAGARTRCSYSGAPANLLTVTSDRRALSEVARRGEEIIVRESFGQRQTCSGGVPTVLNTDTIRIEVARGDNFVDLLLAGGGFAPGATPESEGASEIEVVVSGPDAFGEVIGTRRADEFHWRQAGPHAGLNLNPRSAGDEDVDVTLVGGEFAFLLANGAAGKDRIVPGPGSVIRETVSASGGAGDDHLIAPQNTGGVLDGGPGDDVLTGGRIFNNLIGGPGDDHITGGAGPDLIDIVDGGPGRDFIAAGAGPDRINSRDAVRDRVRCGAGRDDVKADRRDRLRGCEAVNR
jgi:Ca2+-binding RTX toxin-like protein